MTYAIIGFAILMVVVSVDWAAVKTAVKEWFNRK